MDAMGRKIGGGGQGGGIATNEASKVCLSITK